MDDLDIRRMDRSFAVDQEPAGPQDVAAAVNAAVAAIEAAEAAQLAAEAAQATADAALAAFNSLGVVQGVSDADITSSIIWNGTPPSGTVLKKYSWRQIHGIVFYDMRVEYSVAGASNSIGEIYLPSDMPVPAIQTGVGANELRSGISGFMSATLAGAPALSKVFMKDNGAGSYEFEALLNSGTISALLLCFSGWYFVAGA